MKAVIFDLDGPILDSFREGLRRIRIICAIHQIPFTREHNRRLTALWGKPGIELLVEGLGLGRLFVENTLYPAWENYDRTQPPPLVPQAREVLCWLRKNNIRATLLTSRHGDHLKKLLIETDLDRDFVFSSTKTDTPNHFKPDPRVFRHTLEILAERFEIQKNEIIFVGDTPADVKAGLGAEIVTLLVQTGPYLLEHAEDLSLPLSRVLKSIDDVPDWIGKYSSNHNLSFY